jgi:hypothetical protein
MAEIGQDTQSAGNADDQGREAPVTRSIVWRLRWAEIVGLIALLAFALSIGFGHTLAATAFAFSALVGWTGRFESMHAQGKSAVSEKGRTAATTGWAVLGMMALLWARLDALTLPDPQVSTFGKMEAIDACKEGILARAAHPSTVSFPTFDYDFRDEGAGATQVLMSFQAKNGFGLELKYDAQCDFIGASIQRVLLSEARG